MKIPTFIGLLIGSLIWASAQSTPVYTVPHAERQPAWVFPVWFSSADGQMDTIFLCYDPDAGGTADSLFGMYPEDKDRTAFNACVNSCELPFSVYVRQFPEYTIITILENHTYPVTMRFDVRMLFSDSLGIASAPGRPKIEALFSVDGEVEGCPGSPISTSTRVHLTTDAFFDGESDCYRDSIIVLNSGSFLIFTLGISRNTSTAPVTSSEACSYARSVISDETMFRAMTTDKGVFLIYDATGRLIQRGKLRGHDPIELNPIGSGSHRMLFLETIDSKSRCVSRLISW